MIQQAWTMIQFKYHSEDWSMQVRPAPLSSGSGRFDIWYQPDGHDELKGFVQLQCQPTTERRMRWFQIKRKVGEVLLNDGFVQKMGEHIDSKIDCEQPSRLARK